VATNAYIDLVAANAGHGGLDGQDAVALGGIDRDGDRFVFVGPEERIVSETPLDHHPHPEEFFLGVEVERIFLHTTGTSPRGESE
jgi:hypothetical protein